MDDALRYALWDAIRLCLFSDVDTRNFKDRRADEPAVLLCFQLWNGYFKKPFDTMPHYWHDTEPLIRKAFMEAKWYDAYSMLEFLVKKAKESGQALKDLAQKFMEREMAAYRFVGNDIVPIIDEGEIISIETALDKSPQPVRTHLASALEHLSNRTKPDYRNSVKESISAVEAAARILTGDGNATLGQALKMLPTRLPPAFEKAVSTLYGYTSDASGIRHALSDESSVDDAEARFMLVACSAFVNLLRERANSALQ
jgi:hypothetical protein